MSGLMERELDTRICIQSVAICCLVEAYEDDLAAHKNILCGSRISPRGSQGTPQESSAHTLRSPLVDRGKALLDCRCWLLPDGHRLQLLSSILSYPPLFPCPMGLGYFRTMVHSLYFPLGSLVVCEIPFYLPLILDSSPSDSISPVSSALSSATCQLAAV